MRKLTRVTSDWLEATGSDLRARRIDLDERIEHAIRLWKSEQLEDFVLQEGEDESALTEAVENELNRIRSYFLTQRNKDWGYIGGPIFTGVFYYLGDFWELSIPMVFGAPRINALKHLNIDEPTARQLMSCKEDIRDYLLVFADSYDYAYSIEELDGTCANDTSRQFFYSADRHLRATKALLYQERASPKAIDDARMAVEMFLKGYIAYFDALDEIGLIRGYHHNLKKLVDRCIALGVGEISSLENKILDLPDVSSRYRNEERTFGELWGAYLLALNTALAVLRPLSHRDCRKSFGQ